MITEFRQKATLPDGAVQPDTAGTVLRDAGLNPPVGVGFVRAQ
jgi:NitT/TauT family transport system substrate-binding protein